MVTVPCSIMSVVRAASKTAVIIFPTLMRTFLGFHDDSRGAEVLWPERSSKFSWDALWSDVVFQKSDVNERQNTNTRDFTST